MDLEPILISISPNILKNVRDVVLRHCAARPYVAIVVCLRALAGRILEC